MPFTIPLPYSLRLLRCRAGGNALRHDGAPGSFSDDFDFLPIFNLFHSDLALDELVHVRHDDWTLDVHQRERGDEIALRLSSVQNWFICIEQTYPLIVPDQAPVAEPGFTKKWLSYSTAWNLVEET